jgi:hypothetical protein
MGYGLAGSSLQLIIPYNPKNIGGFMEWISHLQHPLVLAGFGLWLNQITA